MKKRTFLLGAVGATGAVIVGWAFLPARQRLLGAKPLVVQPGEVALNGWIRLGADGVVGLIMPRSEMGQGVHTGLAMLVAEELRCELAQIRIEAAPIDTMYGNVVGLAEGVPFHPEDKGMLARSMRWTMTKVMREMGFMMTGGSASIKDLWLTLREAAAMTRASLLQTVAVNWQVPVAQVQLEGGVFRHAEKTLSLGAVVQQWGAQLTPVNIYSLTPTSEFKLIGKPLARLDTPAKVNGQARFGIDVTVPGMVYAAVSMAPQLRGTVLRMDAALAREMPGVLGVVQFAGSQDGTGGVAVIAQEYWQARKALAQVKTEWSTQEVSAWSSAQAMRALGKALDVEAGFTFYKTGDVESAMAAAATRIKAEYSAPYLAHAALEPMNCTVQVQAGSATVWVGTQVPDFARKAVAKVMGLAPEAVTIHVPYLGGGFGRRLEVDMVHVAASIAKQMPGKAIKMIWSREEDMKHDFYRPVAVARFEAGLDKAGALLAWRNTSAGQTIVPQYMGRNAGLPMGGPDKTSSEGAFDQAYEFAHARVAHVAVELPTPVGFWRAVGHSYQGFFKESFIDECAHAAGKDPVLFRAALLAAHPRHKAVLDLAATKAQWGTPLAPLPDGRQRARGIALHESFGSIVVQVAEVSIASDNSIRVHRVVCAIDCGLAVNPNLIAQQMESGVVFGLSAALYGKIDIEQGVVQQSNFHDYPVLRLSEAPEVETHIVASSAPPEGVGEPGLPPIAPAVANAIFALTGKRLRQLPLRF